MKKNKWILFVGVILGLVAVFFLNTYIKSLKTVEEEEKEISYTDVLVAEVSIPKHSNIKSEMVKVVSMPIEAVHPDALYSIEQVNEGLSRQDITKGEQILKEKIVAKGIKSNLAYDIPKGMRAISFPISGVSAVENYLVKGDKIDILATFPMEEGGDTTYTQLQNIEIIAIDSNIVEAPAPVEGEEEQMEEKTGQRSLTVLVTPAQAEVLVFTNLYGSMYLTLRNPLDEKITDLDYFNFSNFATYKER